MSYIAASDVDNYSDCFPAICELTPRKGIPLTNHSRLHASKRRTSLLKFKNYGLQRCNL